MVIVCFAIVCIIAIVCIAIVPHICLCIVCPLFVNDVRPIFCIASYFKVLLCPEFDVKFPEFGVDVIIQLFCFKSLLCYMHVLERVL